MITPMWTIIPPLARPTRPRHPWRRVASTTWRSAEPTAHPASVNATSGASPVAPRHDGDGQRGDPAPRRPEQPVAQQLQARLAPRQHRGDRHQEQQGQPDRRRQPVEVRRADDGAAVLQRLDEQREHRAEQDDEGEHREQHVVGEERALPRQRRVDGAGRAQAVTAPPDQGQRHGDDEAEEHEQVGADRPVTEGVDARQHAGAGQERAQDGQRERGHEQAEVPDPQHPPAFLDEHGVDVGGAGEPRQEAGVLDRVPRPHAAPAEHLVAPPAAEQDADRQEGPREQRPAAGLHQPALADPAGDQGGDGERERHREPDVAEVEDRRVEQHEDVVLQQRVRTGTVEAGRDDGAT